MEHTPDSTVCVAVCRILNGIHGNIYFDNRTANVTFNLGTSFYSPIHFLP